MTLKKFPILLLCGVLLCGLALGQRGQQETLSIDVNLVNIAVSVADKNGRYVSSLMKNNFKVFEDDKPQTITNFSSEIDLPLTIALLVDTSGSIRERLQFEQEAATEFFNSTLLKGKDRALIVSFDSSVSLLQDFTDDLDRLNKTLRTIRAGGGTALYDAVDQTIERKLRGQNGRRVVILISDGKENSSQTSQADILELAQKNDVTIYTISTTPANFGSPDQERGEKILRKLSEETGGKSFFPLKIDDIMNSFQAIREELRSQYQIGYRPTNNKADGTFRKVRVDLTDKRFKARTRAGYYMPKVASSQ
jgi:VWFA-related protein